jgi:hypothetical protein
MPIPVFYGKAQGCVFHTGKCCIEQILKWAGFFQFSPRLLGSKYHLCFSGLFKN